MDETTFQRELSLLKYRVAQMTSTFQARPPYVFQVPSVCNDAFFSDQLVDVKSRLRAMEASINTLHATATARNRQDVQDGIRSPPPPPPQHNRLALPSGPLFWQLFTSLRTDVQGLHGRVADLEQNVSDLEDRVDKLDPSYQLTPPGTENDTFSSFHSSPKTQNQPYTTHQKHVFAASNPPLGIDSHELGPGWAQPRQDWYHGREHLCRNIELPATAGQRIERGPPSQQSAAEGVAFRDREIAQLEELVRDAQDSLKSKEDTLGQKDAEISSLRSERSCQDARIEELDRLSFERASQVQCYGGILAERQREVEKLQEECRAKDSDLTSWEMKFQHLQQSLARKKMQLSQANQELQQLKRETSNRRDLDETLARKDKEIKELHSFCEAKESVAQQQEEIISRGATLLQERDEEVEQLKKSLHRALMPNHNAKVQGDEPPAHPEHPSQRQPAAEVRVGHEISPFATAGRLATAGGTWTPKAFKNYAMLPHESRRASAWDRSRSSSGHYKFGVPGIATPSGDERRQLRRNDSLKLLQRLALAEEGAVRTTVPEAETGNFTNRTRLPLDDLIARPPLPAPLPTSSLEGLSRNGRHEIITDRRHRSEAHSIEELPQRPLLQAYVEEGESGGERNGDE